MFLDDELKQTYNKDISLKEKLIEIIDICYNRIDFKHPINSIKQIDNSFRLFAKTTNDIKEDGFKNCMIKALEKQKEGFKIIKALNW